jgi:hypothetical protein
VVEDGVQLVALQLVRREEADRFGVVLEYPVEVLAGDLHATLIGALINGKAFPVDGLELNVGVVGRLELTELLLVLAGNCAQDLVGRLAVLDKLADFVA